MWTLLLSKLSDPPGVYFDRRQFDGGTMRIGRSAKTCDITLPNDDGLISREHCTIAASGFDLFVTDTSTNGVALNDPQARIVPRQPVPVRVRDRLIIHTFVVTVVSAAEGAGVGLVPGTASAPELPTAAPAPVEDDIWFAAPRDPFWQDSDPVGLPGQDLVHDFLSGGNALFDRPGHDAAFAAEVARHPADAGFSEGLGEAFSRPIMADPVPFAPEFDIPEDWASAFAPEAHPEPAPPPVTAVTPDPLPVPPPVQAAAPAPDWAAFYEGAGLTPQELPLGPDALFKLGQLYRQVVLGLGDILQDRATFKDEFRVERTQLSMGRNNPLKHLAAIEAAKVLLGQPLPGFMGIEEAVRTSLEDLKKHQLAMLAGVQNALLVVFDRLSPAEIERFAEKLENRKRGLLGRRAPDRWAVYVTVFEALRRDATGNANGVMSVAFREGYERFMKSVR
jgi:type VI secretion system FHA domain protein